MFKNKDIKNLFLGTYVRTVVTSYAAFTLIGAILLFLPISVQDNQSLSFIDALFVAASGMSVTGLSTINISTTLTRFGQVVLIVIMQVGGVGIMLFLAGLWVISGKKISLKERNIVVTDQNQLKQGGIIRLVKDVLRLILIIELIGFIVLSSYLYFNNYYSLGESLFQGFFLSISMFANAGFDISGKSMTMFADQKGYFVLTIAMILIFLGSVGYWVLVETKDFIKAKLKKQKFEFSLYVKLIFKMHILLYIIGAILFIIFEANNLLLGKSFFDYIFNSLFMSITTRNAGFTTLNTSQLTNSTHWLFNALMFIGASPNSVGGGIRTSSLIILLYSIYSFAIGRRQVIIGKRAIKDSTIYKAFMVFTVGIIIIFLSVLTISTIETSFSIKEILFEVFSAFGTTGLSLGITPHLTIFSKIILIINMFIGRIGIISLLLSFKGRDEAKNRVKYPEYDMIVGA